MKVRHVHPKTPPKLESSVDYKCFHQESWQLKRLCFSKYHHLKATSTSLNNHLLFRTLAPSSKNVHSVLHSRALTVAGAPSNAATKLLLAAASVAHAFGSIPQAQTTYVHSNSPRQLHLVNLLEDLNGHDRGEARMVGTMGKQKVSDVHESAVSAPAKERNQQHSKRTFKRICVFCGSSSGNKDIFSNVALSLGRDLVSRKVDLVYGGGSIGLMGQVAHTVHAGGGHVVGVIPKALMGKEMCGQTVGELIAVSDMHQRKAEMARLADAFIALPGGYGTLEELLEVITWSQLGIHEKPVGLLNVDGYYNSLLALFDKALEEGFLGLSARNIVVSASTASELLDKLEAYTPIPDWTIPKLCWEDAQCLVYTPTIPSTVEQG